MCDSTKTDRNRVQIMWLELKKKVKRDSNRIGKTIEYNQIEKQLSLIKPKKIESNRVKKCDQQNCGWWLRGSQRQTRCSIGNYRNAVVCLWWAKRKRKFPDCRRRHSVSLKREGFHVTGTRKWYLGASFVVAYWWVRVFGRSGLVDRPSDHIYVCTISLSECMDRRSRYTSLMTYKGGDNNFNIIHHSPPLWQYLPKIYQDLLQYQNCLFNEMVRKTSTSRRG